MAQISQMMLRLEILRGARDHFEACGKMQAVTSAESMLYGLKIAECEAMINELRLQLEVEAGDAE